MKFLSFKTFENHESWGVIGKNPDMVLDLSSYAPNLLEFIRGPWRSKLSEIDSKRSQANLKLTDLELLACLPRPPSMRDGYAFRQHVEAARRNRGVEMIPEFDEFPVYYYTNHQAVVGPGTFDVPERILDKLDFELEAAIVMGAKAINVPAAKADDLIFGYTIMNDLSARTLQMQEMKMSLGPAKGKDFATALGPFLVTPDELSNKKISSVNGNRYDLSMTAIHNDKEVSRGNLKDMNWTFAQIIERASYGTWLYPGDVIGSGTVGTGCYLELNGTHKTSTWLQPGDQIVLRIDTLGELKNVVKKVEASFQVESQ